MVSDMDGAGPDDDLPPLSPGDAIWTANQMYQPRVAEAIERLCLENDRLRVALREIVALRRSAGDELRDAIRYAEKALAGEPVP